MVFGVCRLCRLDRAVGTPYNNSSSRHRIRKTFEHASTYTLHRHLTRLLEWRTRARCAICRAIIDQPGAQQRCCCCVCVAAWHILRLRCTSMQVASELHARAWTRSKSLPSGIIISVRLHIVFARARSPRTALAPTFSRAAKAPNAYASYECARASIFL